MARDLRHRDRRIRAANPDMRSAPAGFRPAILGLFSANRYIELERQETVEDLTYP